MLVVNEGVVQLVRHAVSPFVMVYGISSNTELLDSSLCLWFHQLWSGAEI